MLYQDYTDITSNTTSVKCFVFGAKERRWWVRSRIYEQKQNASRRILDRSQFDDIFVFMHSKVGDQFIVYEKPITLEVHGCLHGARDLPLLLGLHQVAVQRFPGAEGAEERVPLIHDLSRSGCGRQSRWSCHESSLPTCEMSRLQSNMLTRSADG